VKAGYQSCQPPSKSTPKIPGKRRSAVYERAPTVARVSIATPRQ
jgi:hypothetical protein